LSALQFCRYHETRTLETFCSNNFLGGCYAARVAIYLPERFPAFDLLLPLRCIQRHQSSLCFIPILVSVKTHHKMPNLKSIMKGMCKATKNLEAALCLCFWIGMDEDIHRKTIEKSEVFNTHELTPDDIGKFIANPFQKMFKVIAF